MRAMNRNAAIALARQNGFQVENGQCVFSNINRGPGNVWWVDIRVERAFQGVQILLYDEADGTLYCLDVPGSDFRKNAGDFFRQDVNGADTFRIQPSASKKNFMKDLRPGSAGFCFYPFVKKTVKVAGDEECECHVERGRRDGANARNRFDASFPSIKVGIIVLALFVVLRQWVTLPTGWASFQTVSVSETVLHFVLLYAASAGMWRLVWKELHDKLFRECAKSTSFHIHVLATSLAPLLAESFALNPALVP